MPDIKKYLGLKRREIIWLCLILLGLYVIAPQISDFHSYWHLLSHPDYLWLSLACICVAITYFAAAATYCLLALRPLPYVQELAIQLAAMFVNRLLPAGIGGIGTNFEYLRRKGHTSAEAASIVATNNLLGVVGHVLVITGTLLLTNEQKILPSKVLKSSTLSTIIIILVVIVAIYVLYKILNIEKLERFLNDFSKQIAAYRYKPYKTFFALATQIILTLANVVSLSYSAKAVGVNMSFIVILLIFTFGTGIRNVTPTPGGIGGFEAGLVAGFVAYGIIDSRALAAVLLYRLISFWFPLIVGALALVYAERKHWLRA